jgi:hypothetical protein
MAFDLQNIEIKHFKMSARNSARTVNEFIGIFCGQVRGQKCYCFKSSIAAAAVGTRPLIFL